jgi:hypothetical protein
VRKSRESKAELGTQAVQPKPSERREPGGMTPAMRSLILSFSEREGDRAWDPSAYPRRVSTR